MKKTLMTAIVLATALAFGAGVMAQQASSPTPASSAPASAPAPAATSPAPKPEKFHGVVGKVDEATKEVVVRFHKDKLTFSTDNSTKFTEGKKPISFGDLKKGMRAYVTYKKEGEKLMAETFKVSHPKPMAKKGKTAGRTSQVKSSTTGETPAAAPSPEKKM